MYNKKVRAYEPVFLLFAIIGLLLSSCAEESPPARNFSTSQLLISPLPGWGIYSGPEDMQPRYFNLYGAVAGSEIRLMKPPAGIKQWSRDDVDNQLWEPIVEITNG